MVERFLASLNLPFTLLFPTLTEEEAFQRFHDKTHVRVVRLPILLMAILCLPLAFLQDSDSWITIVFLFVCGPCVGVFIITFTRFYQYRLILALVFFVAAQALLYSFAWMLHTNSAIVFYFILHFVHLTAFLRFFFGCCFSIIFHVTKIVNDYAYQSAQKDQDWRALTVETLMEVLAHCCFIYIAYKNESITRNFFRMRNEIHFEKQESEKILLNTLPQQAIVRLAQGEFPVSDRWENAAVVLIEVSFSQKVPTSETSVLLSEIFYILDELTTQYGLEKVVGFRGDEYVVISTLEKASYLCATFSVAVFRQINEYLKGWEANQGFSGLAATRIGIASSTIYGGIVGSEKITYDHWGDGLAVVQKIVASCPVDTIAISGGVYKALSKNGLFNFQPIGSVAVTSLGQVELFTLTDPSEGAHDTVSSSPQPAMNFFGEIFRSKQISNRQNMSYDFNPTTTTTTTTQVTSRLNINKYTLRFDDEAEERLVVRRYAKANLWPIRVFMLVWAILCTLESVKHSWKSWNQVSVMLPVVAMYECLTFARLFLKFSEHVLLSLALCFGTHYLYFAYLSATNLSFYIYPLFLCYLLPLRYTHAAIASFVVYLAYAIILCLTNLEAASKATQVIALFVVIITYNFAAYHIRQRTRSLYIITDNLAISKQDVEKRLQVIIPARIISLLRQGQYPIVYNCQDVGVGCVALTNMQTLTKDYSYNQITLMLHNFHVCAELANQPGLDKIKTIGPLSVVAGGLPTGMHNDVDHMLMLGRWALGVLEVLSNNACKKALGPCMPTLCIVLHFGEVFAGIAGTKKYRFDLWGVHMAKLQKTLEAVKAFDQNAIYVTEEAHEAMGSNFTYKPKAIMTAAGPVYQLNSEVSTR